MPLAEKETKEYFLFFNSCLNALKCGLPLNKDEFNRMHKRLLKLKQTTPNDPAVWDSLGMAACVLGEEAKAIDYHKAAICINPSHALYYHNFATSLLRFNDPKEAIIYSKKAIEKNPNYVFSRIAYIECLLLMGQVAEAKKYAEELLDDKFEGNKEMIDQYDNILDLEIIDELTERAGDPPENFIPIEQAISELQSSNQ